MIGPSQSKEGGFDRPLLYVAEFLHRVRNEYTCAISLASRAASRSSNEEARASLAQVVNHLHALADVHRALEPPLADEPVDFMMRLTKLCRAMASAGIEQRGIELRLAVVEPVMLSEMQCWRASLIISELITNAARHAFNSRAGRISVEVVTTRGRVVCRVNDNGSSAAAAHIGLGTRLVNAIACDLHGAIERRFDSSGTTVTVSFPANRISIESNSWVSETEATAGEIRFFD